MLPALVSFKRGPCGRPEITMTPISRRPQARLIALAMAIAAGLSLASLPTPVEAQTTTKKASSAKKPVAKKKKATTRAKPRKNAPPSAIAGSAASPGMLAAANATARAASLDAAAAKNPSRPLAELLAAAPPEHWREPDAENLVWMEFQPAAQGGQAAAPAQVLMELAPQFAPRHAANIRALVRGGYFDGLAVLRVQDNFVSQWGDPGEGADGKTARPLPAGAESRLPAEFDAALASLDLHALTELDGWAPLNGFVDGFAVAADPAKTPQGRAWLAHCYGVVGAGRGNEIDSSNGSSLYAIIGQPARSLDLNITVVGRVLKGIEHLAALPRGSGNMGFYGPQEAKLPLLRARLLADMPAAERPSVKVLRTDTPTWAELLQGRRHRSGWFVHSAGRVDLCSNQVPVRVTLPGA